MSDNFFAQLKNGKWYEIKSVDKICADLKNSFQYLQEQNEQYAQQLLSFNKDAEIKKYKSEIEHLRKNALLIMSDKEAEAAKEFREKHYQCCHNSSTYLYTLSGTGIGTTIKITCPICNTTIDITDVESW